MWIIRVRTVQVRGKGEWMTPLKSPAQPPASVSTTRQVEYSHLLRSLPIIATPLSPSLLAEESIEARPAPVLGLIQSPKGQPSGPCI